MNKYSVEEVRSHAAMLRDCRINTEATRDKQQDRLADICDAYADLLERIEADEGVVPVAWVKPIRADDYGPEGSDVGDVVDVLFHCHSEKPDGEGWLPTFTHPPAQAAQVDDKCPDCLGYGQNCLAGCSAHPRNWYTCETCGGSGKAPSAEAVTYEPDGSDAPIREEPVAQGEAVLDRAVLAYRVGCTGSVEGHNHRAGIAAVIEALAAQPRAVPDGWMLVPMDATPEMLANYRHVCDGENWQENVFPLTKRQLARHKAAYQAMLAAAPSPGESA